MGVWMAPMILAGSRRLNCGIHRGEDMIIQGKITGVRTVGVPVTDQDRALEFYVGTLGLEKRLDVDMGGGRRWIEVAPAGAATSIALVRSHEGLPAGVETGIRFVTPDADDLHSGLRASGVDADDVLRWDGVPPMFAFRDLDGNGMEIVEQR
jgi:lactoylglutathione lyase